MHRVACYGTLKRGHGNHRLLSQAEFLGETRIVGWKMHSLGGFPGIVKGIGEISIEVYDVTPEELSRLDMLEGYPTFYNRKRVDTEFGEASIYYLNNPDRYIDDPLVVGGEW